MEEEIISIIADELGVDYDDAEKFLNDECGAYASVGGESVWVSGKLVARLVKSVVEYKLAQPAY